MLEYCMLKIGLNGEPIFDESESAQYEWPYKLEKDVITYCVTQGTQDSDAKSKLNKMVGIALTTWGLEIPTKFHRVSINENPDVTIKFENNPTADKLFIRNSVALAYAGYPKTKYEGLVVFNDYGYEWGTKDFINDNGIHVYNTPHVLIHELGHILGLAHDTVNKGKDVMDATYNKKTHLSLYDIYRVRQKYGIRMFSRWSLYERLKRAINYRANNII